MINTNIDTGIRFGIVSANSLHGDVIDEIQQYGTDVHWDDAVSELRERMAAEWADEGKSSDDDEFTEAFEEAVEDLGNSWMDDEPVHEYETQQCSVMTTWLGGAMMVWVFKSPYIVKARLCSPCVPNAGDLDSKDKEDGFDCYDVPPEWYADYEEGETVKIKTEPAAVISTCHITEEDNTLLANGSGGDRVAIFEYGYYIRLSIEEMYYLEQAEEWRNGGFSEAFIKVVTTVAQQGIALLVLDADGETYPGLPQFSW